MLGDEVALLARVAARVLENVGQLQPFAKSAANYGPLSPLSFLGRAEAVPWAARKVAPSA